jgi:hypothetical protein
LDSGNLFWRIQLDQDLLDTIIAIYPEWFKVRKYCDISVVVLSFIVEEGLPEYKSVPSRIFMKFQFDTSFSELKLNCFVLAGSAVRN